MVQGCPGSEKKGREAGIYFASLESKLQNAKKTQDKRLATSLYLGSFDSRTTIPSRTNGKG